MMSNKREASVRIVSRADGQNIEQRFQADVYVKGDGVYIRYEEQAEDLGKTMTTVKVSPDGLKITRRGDVESEQSFAQGRRLNGYYSTPHGRLLLETDTEQLSARLNEGLGSVSWAYTLYAGGEPAGSFRLELHIAASEAR